MIIYSLIKKFEYISFDVFDTLIQRDTISTVEIFQRVGNEYFGKDNDFLSKRIIAEKIARERNIENEVTIEDIYNCFEGITDINRKELAELEYMTELKACRLKKKNIDLYNDIIAAGKNIILISDMYFSSEQITNILKKCGISGYRKIYVSCECSVNKKSGKLFKYVKDKEKIDGKWVHIGDGIKPDFFGAIKARVFPFWIPK